LSERFGFVDGKIDWPLKKVFENVGLGASKIEIIDEAGTQIEMFRHPKTRQNVDIFYEQFINT
jgi:hypothetical protein